MTVSFHTAWKQLNPLNERQGLTVVTVICAAGGGGVGAGAVMAAKWTHHDSSEPVAEGRNNGIERVVPIGRNIEVGDSNVSEVEKPLPLSLPHVKFMYHESHTEWPSLELSTLYSILSYNCHLSLPPLPHARVGGRLSGLRYYDR